ncbi:MAG: glycosyltransferase [Labilithrix sp.]|nr:glycosyltransferase [Labilithrix sp.]
MKRVLFYVDSGGATGGPGMHSVRIWRALKEKQPELVGPLVVPGTRDELSIFGAQIGEENLRPLGVAALVDDAADPVVVEERFYARLCELARREGCDHVHVLWGFVHPAQIDRVAPRHRLPVTITLCDASARGEESDVDAMFFGSDRWERYLRETLRAPLGYLAISDKTHSDALAQGVHPAHVETVHLWVDPKLAELRGANVGDYVAYVGGLAEYKGIGHVLDFAVAYPEYPIKVAGYPTLDFPIDWKRYPSVEHLGYVPYADLVRMMSRARALLYLSYSEGFGLPMIEAQVLGVPLVVNPRNAMVRELLARGSYVSAGNVASPTSIKAAIDVATRDRAELVSRGVENAARFDEAQKLVELERAMRKHHTRLVEGGFAR